MRCAPMLPRMGIDYVIDPRLVRGLDYYSRTVFEWVTDALGSQDAVCSGGRYDGLITQLGGEATPAIGFAMGVERVVELLQQTGATIRAACAAGLRGRQRASAPRARRWPWPRSCGTSCRPSPSR